VAGTALGIPLGALLLSGDASVLRQQTAAQVAGLVVMSLLMTVVIATWFALRNRQFGAEMRARDAQLQLLQGQMEPHFLFNTLANVISLIDADAPRAKQVLEAFTEYLRASLGGMRTGDSTLGAEIELATRFLGLMQARMGDRLRFEVVADPALRGARLPPLLLQPLVENAVRHGLEPLVEGGKVRVEVERVPGEGSPALRLCVEDDGTGLDGPARAAGRGGAGIALANLRARLHALYGAAASLQLAPGAGGRGTRACVIVPWRAADIADAGPATLLPTHHEP
jgi:sensor histidine kinase YesM